MSSERRRQKKARALCEKRGLGWAWIDKEMFKKWKRTDEALAIYRALASSNCEHFAVDGDICCSCGLRVDYVDGIYKTSPLQAANFST